MKTKKYLCLLGFISVIVIVWLAVLVSPREQPTQTSSEKQWKVIVDLQPPENLKNFYIEHGWDYSAENIAEIFHCFASVMFPENSDHPPIQEILDEGGQYWVHTFDPLSSYQENGEITYTYYMLAKDENRLGNDIPPIRQDNAGENFCFYAYHGPLPTGGWGGHPAYSVWWNGMLGLEDGDNFVLTVILPENYELRSDVTRDDILGHWQGGYKDNEFSIFTTATDLNTRFENNRWRVEVGWTIGGFDEFNTGLYLEIYYGKV